ncbi:MAG: ABC transporter substrate-binding protein [Burkholderiaceae bacterium]|jgi:branched-chain amino acid transport system substrate-binding protein|nr:ABC transporter substrate-binding protein [Burkholderiaceae bacterium]
MDRRKFNASLAVGAASALAPFGIARAQPSVLKIAVMNDMSSVYADYQGIGSVVAAQMAAEDYGTKTRKVEVINADHQNKPDVGANIARQWVDTEGVELILDIPNSAVALAVSNIVREKNKVFIGSGAGTSLLTGEQCSPNTVHWTYDTYAQGRSIANAIMKRGGKSWFFVTADYAFGHDLEKQATEGVLKGGGKVLGSVRHPLGTSDFSSFLLRAQSSGAEVVAFANAGGDLINSLKQAAEFNLGAKQMLTGLIFDLNGVPPLGLQNAQGLLAIDPFYWDMNDSTRAWSKRFQQRHPQKNVPNDMQAGVYAGTMHYLKAVDKVGSPSDGRAVVAAMKAMPTDDPLFGKGTIRQDGRKMHPMYLFQVKRPDESRGAWDYYKMIETIPAEEAFRPLSEGGCKLT